MESAGDRDQRWVDSYLRVRKSLMRSVEATNRHRLRLMGAESVGPGGLWLDMGAGDGNLVASLHELGVGRVVAVDYQLDLIRRCAGPASRVCGSAVALPLAEATVDVVVVMDVLHHLPPDALGPSLDEIGRVLRVGGSLLLCEPAMTRTRRMLHVVLMSPASSWFEFSRAKRAMVDAEADTLEPWLMSERVFPELAGQHGFRVERIHRGALSAVMRFQWRGS